MPDDKTQVRVSDCSRIFADQEHEVSYLAQKYGLSQAQIRELISRVGSDRAHKMRGRVTTAAVAAGTDRQSAMSPLFDGLLQQDIRVQGGHASRAFAHCVHHVVGAAGLAAFFTVP